MAKLTPAAGRRPWAWVWIGFLAVLSAGAQEETQQGIFLDTVDVNIINIEVMAFDQDGKPVTGLTREDFELYEDDELIEITNFFAVEGGLRLMMPKAGEEVQQEALGGPAPTATRPPEELRHLILFVDNGNISASHRQRVFNELYELLYQLMNPADRVMVVSQDGDITIEQPFTTDPSLVRAAVERLEKAVGRGTMRINQPALIQRHIEQGEAPPGADALVAGTSIRPSGPLTQPTYDIDARSTFQEVTSYAQISRSEVRQTMAALDRFVSSLAGLPGRKAVVYVSDGLELKPGEFLFRIWDYKYNSIAAEEVGVTSVDAEMDRYALTDEFRQLVAAANANRVSFYTVEGGSAQQFGGVSAETRVAVVDPLARTADGERQDSLRTLASATGGTPLLNGADLKNLVSQLEKDLSTYYSLGYPSPHRGDGKYHAVEVRVKRKGVRLRYLKGYRDKDADERMTDQTLASLLLDVGTNPLEIQIEIGKAERSKERGEDKGFLVPVLVKIPLARLVLLPQEQEHLGRVAIFLAVRDSKGRMSEPQKIEMPLSIPNDQLLSAMSQMAGYSARLRMRPGEQKIAVGVRDELGAIQSTVNLNVDIGG